MTSVPNITLNNGIEIPQLGFGVWQVPPKDVKEATLTAFEIGYRHVDTAQMYGNEQGVGEAVNESGLDRGDVFITSKLNNGYHAHDDALKSFDRSLDKMGFDYLDLFLIHWPLPGIDIDFVETWGALEEIYASGRAKAIGVSNFQPSHLRRVVQEGAVVPAVNQIEVHPFLTQDEARAANAENGVATEAWSPLAQGLVVENPVIAGIAKAHDKSPAQVALRWTLQRGDIVFPKSVTAERIRENFEIFDFELSEADMGVITALDKGHRTGPNPDEFNWIP